MISELHESRLRRANAERGASSHLEQNRFLRQQLEAHMAKYSTASTALVERSRELDELQKEHASFNKSVSMNESHVRGEQSRVIAENLALVERIHHHSHRHHQQIRKLRHQARANGLPSLCTSADEDCLGVCSWADDDATTTTTAATTTTTPRTQIISLPPSALAVTY